MSDMEQINRRYQGLSEETRHALLSSSLSTRDASSHWFGFATVIGVVLILVAVIVVWA